MTRERFIMLVKVTEKVLRRFLVALCCGDNSLADDIAQETYLKAWLSIETVRDKEKFMAWLYRIAYNQFVDHTRSRRLADPLDSAVHVETAEVADAGLRYEDLYRALSALNDKERTAILLFYIDDYPVKDIAGITGSSVDAVKQQLTRGRLHLKELLNERK